MTYRLRDDDERKFNANTLINSTRDKRDNGAWMRGVIWITNFTRLFSYKSYNIQSYCRRRDVWYIVPVSRFAMSPIISIKYRYYLAYSTVRFALINFILQYLFHSKVLCYGILHYHKRVNSLKRDRERGIWPNLRLDELSYTVIACNKKQDN